MNFILIAIWNVIYNNIKVYFVINSDTVLNGFLPFTFLPAHNVT